MTTRRVRYAVYACALCVVAATVSGQAPNQTGPVTVLSREGRRPLPTVEVQGHSMVGLDGWTFPEEWTMVEGDRVVSFWWNRLPGTTADGQPLQAPGLSILRYAGDGRFDYELDILNMAEVFELMKVSDWRPSAAMHAPPDKPDRNPAPPR